jgi:hypothetical protein
LGYTLQSRSLKLPDVVPQIPQRIPNPIKYKSVTSSISIPTLLSDSSPSTLRVRVSSFSIIPLISLIKSVLLPSTIRSISPLIFPLTSPLVSLLVSPFWEVATLLTSHKMLPLGFIILMSVLTRENLGLGLGLGFEG